MMKIFKMIKRAGKYILRGVPVVKAEISFISPDEILKDRIVLITGGTRGIGKSIAKKCISEGAHVIISGRNKDNCIKASDELGCLYIQGDISNVKSTIFESSFFTETALSSRSEWPR